MKPTLRWHALWTLLEDVNDSGGNLLYSAGRTMSGYHMGRTKVRLFDTSQSPLCFFDVPEDKVEYCQEVH